MEEYYLRQKLASQIEQRESRLARLEAMERADRICNLEERLDFIERRREQPLRRSKSREPVVHDRAYERVF